MRSTSVPIGPRTRTASRTPTAVPDIDNDGDHVLDIADKCPMQPETYNGFEDEDSCPDTVPPDVEGIKGTVEGLLYAEGETVVRDSALPSLKKIAKIMTDHPSVKVVLIGHTDNVEAKAFAPRGRPEPAAAADLGCARDRAAPRPCAGGEGSPDGDRDRRRKDRRRRRGGGGAGCG